MKKIIMLGALLCNALLSFGCDQCGCGLLAGVQPHERTDQFGLQFRMRYLQGELFNSSSLLMPKHGGMSSTTSTNPTSSYTEMYYALEARGQFWIGQRTSLVAAVPLVNNYQAIDGVRHADVYAVGDPLAMLRYELITNRSCGDSTATRHRFTVGFGAKFPLGRHDTEQYGETLDHDLQPGTGTWDGLISAEYQMRGMRWGTAIGALGRFNGTSSEGHRMGHSLSATAEVFRVLKAGSVQIFPSAGGYMEHAGLDHMNGEADGGTGGSVVFSHLSTRMYWRAFSLSLTWQHALLNDEGEMMIPNRERVLAGITYVINRKDRS